MNSPTASTPSEAIIRAPLPNELPRVLHLFRNMRLRKESRFLVAERTHPLARFVAAAAWWSEGAVAHFELASQPAAPADAVRCLIRNVLAAGREAGLEMLQYSELLPDGSPWGDILQAEGFERVRSERCFETDAWNTWMRIHRLYERHKASIPPGWRTDPIGEHGPEVILDLITPHRLLTPDDVRYCWQTSAAAGFDPEMSCILFDGDRPFGAFLARLPTDVLFVDVQVVTEPNPRLRSLGDLCLVYHVVRRVRPEGPIHFIRFRCGETEHRQTANLAMRMGGRELGRMHVFGKRLNP